MLLLIDIMKQLRRYRNNELIVAIRYNDGIVVDELRWQFNFKVYWESSFELIRMEVCECLLPEA